MASSSAPAPPFQPSTLIRLAPLQLSEIPAHADLPLKPSKASLSADTSEDSSQPDLLPFITTLLSEGLAFFSKSQFSATFKHHSVKKAPPSAGDVEVSTYSLSPSQLQSSVPWAPASTDGERRPSHASTNGTTTAKIKRAKPKELQAEHWFARKSIHSNIGSKSEDKPGHASWEEFIYGLRDNHSQHEEDFTPNLFDARKIVDWDGQVRKLEEEGSLARAGFSDVSMGVFEMCHDVPSPLKPRCFGVLVVTGSVTHGSGQSFWEADEQEKLVAVTVPLQLGGVKKAFYATYRNLKEGEDEKRKREVVQGFYTAVETCTLRSAGKVGADEAGGEEVEWIMATASDAKGVLPMWAQKLALPGAVPKDVSYFMKWIKTVDEAEIETSAGT